MPWSARDAYRHTKKASTPETQHKWASIANTHLEKSGDEAAAIRIANAAMSGGSRVPKKRSPKRKSTTYG